MPLKFLTPIRKSSSTTTRTGGSQLTQVKNRYVSHQQQVATQQQSRIKQLSENRTRINRAIPGSTDPVKTALKRKSQLVGNQIGWLQSLVGKK